MQESEIKKAAAELLTQIESQTRPANEQINTYTRSRRYIGSKDRRALTAFVWGVLRHKARLHYLLPNSTWEEQIYFYEKYLSSSTQGCQENEGVLPRNKRDIPPLSSLRDAPNWVQWETPAWLIPLIPHAQEELPALLASAPIVLRALGDRENIAAALLKEGIPTSPTTHSPYGLILHKRSNLISSPSYKEGKIEIQDEGSQLVALETGIHEGDQVLDYCAGAGGKSLIFAQMMLNKGLIVAHDISARSLEELKKRAQRAKTHIISTQVPLPAPDKLPPFTHVVVDAPCSGTGTWRRCPDARWNLSPKQLAQLVITQEKILEEAHHYVAPQGYLSYMTCSLTACENSEQIAHFLKKHPEFHLIKERQFSPYQTQTDGLYIALMQKNPNRYSL